MSASLDQLYQQVILDHAKRRIGYEPFAAATAAAALAGAPAAPGERLGSSHQVNPTCGDEITVEARWDDASGRLRLRWDGAGCSISMASASVLTELADELDDDEFAAAREAFHALMHSRGGTGDEAVLGDAAAFAGVSKFPGRIKCALLAWVAAEDAAAQARAA